MVADRSEGLMSVGYEGLAAVREDVIARGEQFYRGA
jgi:hypothetical protein